MKYSILLFNLIFFLHVSMVFAGNNITQPQSIAAEYCRLDFQGARLSSRTYAEINRLVSWEEEPGWDSVFITDKYEITGYAVYGDEAEVTVEYTLKGSISGQDFTAYEKTETVIFRLGLTGGVWKITEPLIPPHCSAGVLLAHYTKLNNPEHEKVISFLNRLAK